MECPRCGGSGKIQGGAEFRKQRLRLGIPAKTVAEFMGVSPQYYSDLELGRRHWSGLKVAVFNQALQALKG